VNPIEIQTTNQQHPSATGTGEIGGMKTYEHTCHIRKIVRTLLLLYISVLAMIYQITYPAIYPQCSGYCCEMDAVTAECSVGKISLLQDILHPSNHLLNVLLQIANKLGLSTKKIPAFVEKGIIFPPRSHVLQRLLLRLLNCI
jgi:hypothetical protein